MKYLIKRKLKKGISIFAACTIMATNFSPWLVTSYASEVPEEALYEGADEFYDNASRENAVTPAVTEVPEITETPEETEALSAVSAEASYKESAEATEAPDAAEAESGSDSAEVSGEVEMPDEQVMAEEDPDGDGVAEGVEVPDDVADEDAFDEEVETPDGQILENAPSVIFEQSTDEVRVTVVAGVGVFPEGTTMEVVPAGDEDTISKVSETVEDEKTKVTGVKAVEVTFYNAEHEEIEPSGPVFVTLEDLTRAKDEAAEAAEAAKAVHVDDKGECTVMEEAKDEEGNLVELPMEWEEEQAAENDQTVSQLAEDADVAFVAESFSTYALVYTVDFHWEVDGQEYEFSIPGGGFVSLGSIVDALGIIENDALSERAEDFVADVEALEFSDPELVWIGKTEAAASVGELKEANGLDVEYSADLTEEQIDEINAQTVEAGDWALISMRPFTSEEVLSVSMKNGEEFAVRVTDAQIKKTVIDAKGDSWEITVTYGPEAGIPDGTELKVVEYSKEDRLFNECFSDREKWIADITQNSDNDSHKDGLTENNEGLTFEQGFGDAVNYEIDGKLTKEDKAQASSMIHFTDTPAINGYILFDISLIYDGTEIEPLAPVQVTIQSTNPKLQESDEISVGHYVENTTDISHERSMETIDEISYSSDDKKANTQLIVDFETSSFSLYDVTGIQWTANQSKTVYYALKTGINKVLSIDQNGTIPVMYSQIENMDPSAIGSYIQSLPDYANAEPIIIYDKSGSDFYAIDGNGNLARVYESGDTVMWNGKPSIGWKLVRYMNESGEYTGYYDFINMETGKFLAPQASQTISDNRIGIQLDGAAGHNSTIKAWDNAINAYCGYSIQNNQLVTNDSIEWFFASVSQTTSDDLKLQTVETVDSASMGVTIKMFDYPLTGNTNNRTDFQRNFNIVNSENKDWVSGGTVIQGLVKNTLNSDGFPVATYRNTNLNGLFTGGNGATATDANHLFIKQTYDETGYFEYSSFENYAYLGSGTDFTVYRQIGAEDIAYAPGKKTYGNSTDYYFNRGNFLPFNSIADYKTATQKYGSSGVTNKYDENGNRLSDQDPRKGEALFLTQENVDYFFGMSMEANFYQPVDGQNNGEDIIYEFNGDDDLWVFIDNVLVLDIGGCHHAHSGFINFSTGEVQVETGNGIARTTIKQCFKNANIFPDGTRWNDSKVNQYFRGNTIADYSQHNMKMFYMERGAGASNLHIKFNLPVIKDAGKLIVDKVVSGTQNAKYSNEKFPFQVIKVDGTVETRFTQAVYESNGQPVEYKHEVVIDGTTYNDVFYLRPGEAAVFDVNDNSQQYYVKELGIDTSYYDRVLINRENATISNGIAASSVSSVKNRNRVTYDNHGITEDLRIKKIVEGDVKNDRDTFEFYVYLTGKNKEMIPYSNGDYYVLDPNGNYCTYVNGLPVGDPSITEATRTAYHSGQWGTVGSIPDGYTVLIPDLLVGTDFVVSERMDNLPEGYELKKIGVDAGTSETANLAEYTNVTTSDAGAITIGSYTYPNHCEGKLKKDTTSDATVTATNQAAKILTINKVWQANDYVTVHGPVHFALYKLVSGNEVLVENTVKTLTAPNTSIEYRIAGNLAEYVVREVVVTTEGNKTTVTPVANNGVIEVTGETTKLGTNMTDSYIVTYQQGEATATSRTDTVTNKMPQLTVNKKDISGNQLNGAEFKLTGSDGETALTGYGSLKSDNKTSGNLLDGIYLSNGTYYLVETKAPDGFYLLSYKVKLVVSGNDASKIITASAVPESAETFTDQTPDNNLLYTFNILNTPGDELPATGGSGTRGFLYTGLALMLLAMMAGFVWRRKRA